MATTYAISALSMLALVITGNGAVVLVMAILENLGR